ncbi:MAG: hypothetical protein AAF149_13345 [Bacteroidota bacterium]
MRYYKMNRVGLVSRFYIWLCLLVFIFSITDVLGQKRKGRFQDRDLQISLVPGVSTNGLQSGWYFNKFSINLFSGMSASSQHLEIAGISNSNILSGSGIQIAGIANVVGTNSFVNLTISEERERMKQELDKPMMHGIQLSGLVNLVRGDVSGIQITGGFNQSYGSMTGFELAGLGNVIYGNLIGAQLSGLFNNASRSVSGMQISVLGNVTRGPLGGTQIGFYNKNQGMSGKNINPPTKARSLQLGLFNFSKTMGGTQIGLLNVAKEMSGTQIGLINIFSKRPPKKASKSGAPIGLLNFGSRGHFTRLSYNDQFVYNIERSTGNCSNCSDTQYGEPLNARYKKFNQNSIIASYNPSGRQSSHGYWALGWRFERLMYVKFTNFPKRNGPQNGAHFLAWGVGVQHVNWTREFHAELSLLTSIQASYGKRVNLLGSRYLYLTARLNGYAYENRDFQLDQPLTFFTHNSDDMNYRVWPGYTIGIQI